MLFQEKSRWEWNSYNETFFQKLQSFKHESGKVYLKQLLWALYSK